MLTDPAAREYISPVVYWESNWNAEKLVNTKINKESRAYKQAYDKECVRVTNKGR